MNDSKQQLSQQTKAVTVRALFIFSFLTIVSLVVIAANCLWADFILPAPISETNLSHTLLFSTLLTALLLPLVVSFVRSFQQFTLKIDHTSNEQKVIKSPLLKSKFPPREIETTAHNMNQYLDPGAILFSIEEGVLALNSGLDVISINRAAQDMVGIAHQSVLGHSLHDLVLPTQFVKIAREVLRTNGSCRAELLLGENRERIVDIKGTILRDNTNETLGVVLVMNDVTNLRRLENVRRDFVANVSHELRTPVASIQGFTETLLDGAIEDTSVRQHFLEIILHQSKRLKSIIDDLLKLAQMENSDENYMVEKSDVNIGTVLETVKQLCEVRAREMQIQLSFAIDQETNILGNRVLLEQALVNLVDNAIKYNKPGGSVDFSVTRIESEVVFVVSDTGIGIAPDQLPRLFERFYRVDKGRARKEGGSGLGLSIVKHIAGIHQGRVSVESTPGQGSKFYFILPAQVEEQELRKVVGQ